MKIEPQIDLNSFHYESISVVYLCIQKCGSSSVGRASAFQAECREFEPRLPLHRSESFGIIAL